MSDAARQLRQADEFVRRLTAAVRANQLYAPSHPLAGRALKALAESAGQLLAEDGSVTVGFIDNEVVVGEIPLVQVGDAFAELLRRVRQVGIERIVFDRGVEPDELGVLVETLARPERAGVTGPGQAADPLAVLGKLTRIRVGRLSLDERVEASSADVATIRRLYTDGVSIAGALWEMTQREGIPDPKQAKALVDSLAQAVAQNRTALMALTALKDYDNYTFTHMVNVSILVMAQARSLGIDGTLLREFGLAALMHDIGKVRTPLEVLNKPDKLTDAEFAIMRMHVVDGAEILRRTPDIPALAPVVAFEHHLRLDGTGYPMGVKRATAQPRHDAVQHLGRLRRDAVAARLPGRLPHRAHPGGAAEERRRALRPAPGAALLAADGPLPARQHGAARHRARRRGHPHLRARSAAAAGARHHRRRRPPADAPLRRQPVGGRQRDHRPAHHLDAGRSEGLRGRSAHLPVRPGDRWLRSTRARVRPASPWLAAALAAAIAVSAPRPAAQQRPSPTLLVLVVVDQMRADYLARFDRHFTSGFRRLIDQGAIFERTFYPYLNTVTCVGHATLGTGAWPKTHGIILNEWYRRDLGRVRSCTADAATTPRAVRRDAREGRPQRPRTAGADLGRTPARPVAAVARRCRWR